MEQAIRSFFPGAVPGREFSAAQLSWLQDRGGALRRTLLATSLCSDDINTTSTTLQNKLLGPFVLGGLGGLPFAGLTGITAFAHHVPDRGAALIFYGPHIGITRDGELGRVQRPGQSKETSCCGALMLALRRAQAPGARPSVPDLREDDIEQCLLERALAPHWPEVLRARHPILALTEAAYAIIHRQVMALLAAAADEFHCPLVLAVGGIIVNTAPDSEDYVVPRDRTVAKDH